MRSANIRLSTNLRFDFDSETSRLKLLAGYTRVFWIGVEYPDDEDTEDLVGSTGFGGLSVLLDIPHRLCYVIRRYSSIGISKAIIDYIMDLFIQEKTEAEVSICPENFSLIPFEKLSIDSMDISGERPMNQEQVTCALEAPETTDRAVLTISVEVEGVAEYSMGFRYYRIHIDDGSWIHLDAILNSRSAKIEIYGMRTPEASQLNTLIKDWISMTRMKNLNELFLNFNAPIVDADEVMSGVRPNQPIASYQIDRIDGEAASVYVGVDMFTLRTFN